MSLITSLLRSIVESRTVDRVERKPAIIRKEQTVNVVSDDGSIHVDKGRF
jgi:flagella basal body P-ring formation protein FlgA